LSGDLFGENAFIAGPPTLGTAAVLTEPTASGLAWAGHDLRGDTGQLMQQRNELQGFQPFRTY
jgi:hypothetical protein